MRNQACEWETFNDEAPRATKRKYQDLEQRSAGEHELLNYLRVLPELDSLELLGRLRDGCSVNDLLISARELSETPDALTSGHTNVAIQQPNTVDEQDPRVGLDSGSHQLGGEIHPSSRPILPPISSFWYGTPFRQAWLHHSNPLLTTDY